MKPRIDYIDSLKGFGIILVIIGHMQLPYELRKWVFSFHMPLFFFISGYLYKSDRWLRWLCKRVDGLVIMYYLYSFVLMILLWWSGKFTNGLLPAIKAIVNGDGIGVTWFLMCLFIAEIIGVTIIYFSHGTLKFLVPVTFVLATGGWLVEHSNIPVILMNKIILQCSVFWLVGYMVKELRILQKVSSLAISRVGLICLCLFAVSTCYLLNIRVSLARIQLGNPFLFYLSSLSSIMLFIIVFSRSPLSPKLLSYIGRNSLLFMVWHGVLPMIVKNFVLKVGFDPTKSVVVHMILIVIDMLILFCFVYLINRYSLLLSGKMRILTSLYDHQVLKTSTLVSR